MAPDRDGIERAVSDVDFPSGAPEDACIDAIRAAHAYVHDNGGGTRDEIVDALVPEENYPIGASGVQASARGLVSGFRAWWWSEIVRPGLRVLADVEPVDGDETSWRPVDEPTGDS